MTALPRSQLRGPTRIVGPRLHSNLHLHGTTGIGNFAYRDKCILAGVGLAVGQSRCGEIAVIEGAGERIRIVAVSAEFGGTIRVH